MKRTLMIQQIKVAAKKGRYDRSCLDTFVIRPQVNQIIRGNEVYYSSPNKNRTCSFESN